MKILIAMILLGAVAMIVLSVKFTVKMFGEFGTDKSAEERTEAIRLYRNKMICCYAAAVGLITAAAMLKLFMM